jgi:hypothetical protein
MIVLQQKYVTIRHMGGWKDKVNFVISTKKVQSAGFPLSLDFVHPRLQGRWVLLAKEVTDKLTRVLKGQNGAKRTETHLENILISSIL